MMPEEVMWSGVWSLSKNSDTFRLTSTTPWEDLEQTKRLYEIGVQIVSAYLCGAGKPN